MADNTPRVGFDDSVIRITRSSDAERQGKPISNTAVRRKSTIPQRSKAKNIRSLQKALQWIYHKQPPSTNRHTGKLLFMAAGVTALALAWQQIVAPLLLKLPDNFSYRATIISYDNFYNEQKAGYEGRTLSDTQFGYHAVLGSSKDGVIDIKNSFEVSTTAGQKIFAVERMYGINQKTWQHAPNRGDHNRTGYLFAPANIAKDDFIYWHVNYDTPAPMKFQEEEDILGLTTYRYAADFGVDQTQELAGVLPDVGESRGVSTDVNLQLWIEPRSGHLVQYEDHATAYYYDLVTGKRLNPWNQFSNIYNFDSVVAHVQEARQQAQYRELKLLSPSF